MGSDESFVQNILYSCSSKEVRSREDFVPEHVLSYGIAGTLRIHTSQGKAECPAGTLGFTRRNQLVKATKLPGEGGRPFRSINLFLWQQFLRRYAAEKQLPPVTRSDDRTIVSLTGDPFLPGFFQSLAPYETRPQDLTPRLAELKTREAVELILRHDPTLHDVLFDFSDPYKTDLEAFMKENFTFRASLDELARMSGRSLSTFKRDFRKIFGESPEKWLISKRLEEARYLIAEEGIKPSEVYEVVGFENFSHFSTAFKARFGITASKVRRSSGESRVSSGG